MTNRKSQTRISINSENGGKGDIWMRLASFYVMCGLSNVTVKLKIPTDLIPIAKEVFGDRLIIAEENFSCDYTFTSLGLKHLIKPLLKGKKFLLPYALPVFYRKKQKKLKDYFNFCLLQMSHFFQLTLITHKDSNRFYQGFIEASLLKPFKKILYKDFVCQLEKDYTIIAEKLRNICKSHLLTLPNDLNNNFVIFPTGTGRQFFPAWWAKQYLSNAYYAFYTNDTEKLKFKEKGLKTIEYFAPSDIVVLSRMAKWAISSDSFPSHILQYFLAESTITLTEATVDQIISPVFKGKIVPSMAACHPCLHLDRGNHPLCEAGYKECLNWKNPRYTNAIINSLPS